MSSPSDQEQLTLELINRFRLDPTNEYDRLIGVNPDIDFANAYFGVDLVALELQLGSLSAVAPLAWSEILAVSADTHSQRMIRLDDQQHNFANEPGLRGKFDAAGYTPFSAIAENIFAYSDDAFYGHAAFVIDWGWDDTDWIDNGDGTRTLRADWQTSGDGIQDPAGHRIAIMSEAYHEVGVGIILDTDPATSVGPYVTTHHFGGPSQYTPQFVGVVIDDRDADNFYDIGEGLGGVDVILTGDAGTFSTTTWASGGWQIVVPAGTYTVTFSGGALQGQIIRTATLGTENVKLDAMASEAVPTSPPNSAPVATLADQTIGTGAWRQLSTILSVTDTDGDSIAAYEIWDDTGATNWWADGGYVDASGGYITSTLSDIWVQGDSTASTQILRVRAQDGTDWGNWVSFNLNTEVPNVAPVVAMSDQVLTPGEWVRLDTLISVADSNGDTVQSFELWDSVGGHNWWADGGYVDASGGYTTSDLSGIWLQGDPVASTQTLWLRAEDGRDWSAWTSFDLTTQAPTSAAVVSIADQALAAGAWIQLESVLSLSGMEASAIQSIELLDSEGGHNWWADNRYVDASGGYVTRNLSDIWFQADASVGVQTLQVRVHDSNSWSAWDSFSVTTNTPPTATVADQTLAASQWRLLTDAFIFSDADGDALGSITLWDNQGAHNWWADGGYVDASAGYTTDDLAGVWFQGDSTPGDQTLWVQASDGMALSAWDSFVLTTG